MAEAEAPQSLGRGSGRGGSSWGGGELSEYHVIVLFGNDEDHVDGGDDEDDDDGHVDGGDDEDPGQAWPVRAAVN